MRKINFISLLIVFLLVTAMLLGEETPPEAKGPWKNITKNLLMFSDSGDNVFLLKRGEKGVLFGAGNPYVVPHLKSAGVKEISYIFLWNTRRSQVSALQAIITESEKLFGVRPHVGAADAETKLSEPCENKLLEKNREFWEIMAWRTVAESVLIHPADVPLFSIKPDVYYRRRKNEGHFAATWESYLLSFWQTAFPHRLAHTIIFNVDGKRVAISGRLLFNDGKVKVLHDLWTSDDQDFKPPLMRMLEALELFRQEKVDLILPESGSQMTFSQAESSLKLLSERIKKLSQAIPLQIRMDFDAYPGIQRIDLERDAYVINGGDEHYLVVNPGYPPALTEIPKIVGENGKIDLIFSTDCRDLHNVSAPSLSEIYKSTILSCPNAARIQANPTAFLFPRNSTRRIPKQKIIGHGKHIEWRGAKLYFYELPELPIAQQMMLMETTGSRVLFIGDALVNLRMFPFNSPYYSPDLRLKSLKRVVTLIKELKPTYIVDDWGVREITEPLDFSNALNWAADFEKSLKDVVFGENPERAIDPFWIRTDPDVLTVEWGKKVSFNVIVRNFSNNTAKMELSLVGEYLNEGKDWKTEISLGPQEILRVPVVLSVASDCPRTGTAVAISVQEGKITSCPAQLILLEKKVIK